MEDKGNSNVPYIVFEGECARHERTVKRLVTVIVITILLLVVSNMAWLYVFNQYDISSEVVTVENEGDADSQNVQGVGANAHGVIGNESAEGTGEK
jgi:hypothetical protein